MDAQTFRNVMSQWPTGVCVVTGTSPDHGPVGMVIGSFCSISLAPPLVAFFVKAGSSTWQGIQSQGGRFCVNVLSHAQAKLCTTFSSGDPAHRFDGLRHEPTPGGAPMLPDCCAWIEASCDRTIELGDHLMVVGLVHDMRRGTDTLPLVFSRGRLHRTEVLSSLSDDHFSQWEDSLQAASPVWRL